MHRYLIVGRRLLLDAALRPQAILRAEGFEPALGGDAGAGEDDDILNLLHKTDQYQLYSSCKIKGEARKPMMVNRIASDQPILWAACACLLVLILGSCTHTGKRLAASERKECLARGGYESRSGFGYPLCQFDYSDGGKVCSDKADCQGRCLNHLKDLPNPIPKDRVPKAGDASTGFCEMQKSTFGCYAVIEKGKISGQGAFCED